MGERHVVSVVPTISAWLDIYNVLLFFLQHCE